MKNAIVIKKTKVNDSITLLKGYTGHITDETTSFFIFYCNELDKTLLVNKLDLKIY